jgi:FkbM family methyltransferase
MSRKPQSIEKLYYIVAVNIARLSSKFIFDFSKKTQVSRQALLFRIVQFLHQHKNEIAYLAKDQFKILELNEVFSMRNANLAALESYFKEKKRKRMHFFKSDDSIYAKVGNFIFLLPFPHGIFELAEVFYDNCYGSFDISDGTVVDIGAFIGDTSIYFTSVGAKNVIAYEPVPCLYEIAKKNTIINKLAHKISVNNEAIGNRYGEIIIYENLYWPGKSSIFSEKVVRSHKVRVVPLSDVISDFVDLLKIDCEGCEYISIKDAYEKGTLKNVNHIIVETHGNFYCVLSMLQKASFKIEKVIGSEQNRLIYATNHSLC